MSDWVSHSELDKYLRGEGITEEDLAEDEPCDTDKDPFYSPQRAAKGFSYDMSEYKKYRENNIARGCQSSQCQHKGKALNYPASNKDPCQYTVDHGCSVKEWEDKHPTYTRSQAYEWYNNQSNWEPMHRGCNSSKGG